MALHLHIGPGGAGKTTSLHRTMFENAKKDFFHNHILIVPEQFTLETQRAMVSESPNHCIMNIDVLSFRRLAYRVMEELGMEQPIVLEDTGKGMIVKKVALDKRSELKLYAGRTSQQGFIDEMKSVISEFIQYGIYPADIDRLSSVADEGSALRQKLKDIGIIYTGFKDFCEGRFIVDEEILDILLRVADRSEVLKNASMYFDGFTGFTYAQLNLLAVLLRICTELHVTVTMDTAAADLPYNEESLFGLSAKTIDKLKRLAADCGCEVLVHKYDRVYRLEGVDSLSFLEANIFRHNNRVSGKSDGIRVVSCESVIHELHFCIDTIKKTIVEKGYHYRDFAIVTGDMSGYGRQAARAFAKAGIPCFIDSRKNIIGTSEVEMLRAVLEIAARDFSFESVFRYLKSGMGPLDTGETDELENYCLARGIKGLKMWKKIWSAGYKTRYGIDFDRLNGFREKVVEGLAPAVRVLRSKTTVSERITALRELLKVNGVEDRLAAEAEERFSSDNEELKLLGEESAQLFECVEGVFERIESLLGDEIITAKEFSEILDTGFKEAQLGFTPQGSDSVLVGDIERSRISAVKVLFLIGVNDGIVPKGGDNGGLLSDADRTLLAQNDIELSPTCRQNTFLGEFYLYLSLTKPSEELYLIWHRLDKKYNAALPSYLISTVTGMYDGLVSEELSEPVYDGVLAVSEPEFITPTTAAKLYGEVLRGSVSMLEKYAKCAYSHFLNYGLKLEERQKYSIGYLELGDIYHKALEVYFKKVRESGMTWQGSVPAERDRLKQEAVCEAFADFTELLEDSSRNGYTRTRVERILDKTIAVLDSQIKSGSFEPEMVEKSFESANEFMKLSGKIDRMDVYTTGGVRYLRIIDYKTGVSEFNLNRLYQGLSIQLAVYMKEGLKLMREEGAALPAGMYYYNIDDPIVEISPSELEAEQMAAVKQKAALRLSGPTNAEVFTIGINDSSLVNESGELLPNMTSEVINVKTKAAEKKKKKDAPEEAEPVGLYKGSKVISQEHFEVMFDYLDKKIAEQGRKIMSGNIAVNPIKEGQNTPCSYCSYANVCGFDRELGSEPRRFEKMSEDDIWEAMKD